MARKLKVFRTSAGFDDAYVAAPSRKAALAAWGADADLFARGVAEEVADPKLTVEPLKRPGEVVRLSRGDLASHMKALGPRRKKAKAEEPKNVAKPRKVARPRPPPKRDKVDAAEAALRATRQRHSAAEQQLEAERDAIDSMLEALRARHARELAGIERKRDAARDAYRDALERWSD